MPKAKISSGSTLWAPTLTQTVNHTTPVQQPETFSPPLSMQQAIWDSVLNGNFIDAKLFAYSRHSREPGRVDTPKALFVNTHVLAAACGYFRSTFDLSDGIETSLTAVLPPGLETVADMEEKDSYSDYDLAEKAPAESDSDTDYDPANLKAPTQTRRKAPTQVLPERSVKAYLVKYTAYRTLYAIIWYIYSGHVAFSPNESPESPSSSAKSIYRFADEHGMDDLKKLASKEISSSINRLESSNLMEEAFSIFTSRYPELHDLYIQRLRSVMSQTSSASGPFQRQMSHYCSGKLPHSKDFVTSLLQTLMLDRPAVSIPRGGNCNTIPRVSHPWPVKTRNALRVSLDHGIFEDICVTATSFPEATKHPVYFAKAVDKSVRSSISRFCRSEPTSQQDSETSLITWRAIAYYLYTGCISFQPLGVKSTEPAPVHSPSDTVFRGYTCPPREVLYVARKLGTFEALAELATNAIVSGMTPDNVFEEMFRSPPPPTKIIDKGTKIIRENRDDDRIRSQLQKLLEDAASGDSPAHAIVLSACFIELLPQNPWGYAFG